MNETSDKRCALFKQLSDKARICLFYMKTYFVKYKLTNYFKI